MKYAVIVEAGETSFGAHVPDLPGCVAVADTKEQVLDLIQEAIEFISKACARMVSRFPSLLPALNMLRYGPHNKALQLTAR